MSRGVKRDVKTIMAQENWQRQRPLKAVEVILWPIAVDPHDT